MSLRAPPLMASATSSSGNGFRTVASQALNGFVERRINSSPRGLRLQKEKRPPEGGHRVKAIRNWQFFRERTRMPLQSINCGDQVIAVEDLKQPVGYWPASDLSGLI